jgi:hypothetical protein
MFLWLPYLHPPIIWHFKGLYLRDSVSGVLSANRKPANSLTLLNCIHEILFLRTDGRRARSYSCRLNPAYTEATEGSPVGGGITVNVAFSLSTYCFPPLQFPHSLVSARSEPLPLICIITASIRVNRMARRLEGERETWRGAIKGTPFRGLIIVSCFLFGSTVACVTDI